jgi:hypothetical protein
VMIAESIQLPEKMSIEVWPSQGAQVQEEKRSYFNSDRSR